VHTAVLLFVAIRWCAGRRFLPTSTTPTADCRPLDPDARSSANGDPSIAVEPVAGPRGRRLEADDFDRLAIGDPVRGLLGWMSDNEGFERRCDPNRWATFKDICWREFSFGPDEDGTQGASDALLHGSGKWDQVWRRFCDAPRLYPGVSAVLRQARPRDLLGLADHSRRPGLNEEQEDKLRKEFEGVLVLPHAQACDKIAALDDEHRERRGWVWAQLGESPYAVALEPLGRLAKAATTTLGGATAETMAADYAAQGWRCDRAAMEALSRLKQGGENALVTKVVRTLYEPWLDRSARRFQELMSAPGVDPHKLAASVAAERDACVLFADGLRFDVGAVLQERREALGFRVRMAHRIAPIPTSPQRRSRSPRRRVKEQQRRVFKSEFRNTHFSYILGPDGPEQFVSTPELHSDEANESGPLPPGQVVGRQFGNR
jgi:hypothetical protein